jgi:predicted DNA-binding protein
MFDMISLRLPNNLEQQLINFANQTHRTKTEVVRLALERLFESETATAVTEGERALQIFAQNGLLNAISADADLSTNYKAELDWSHKL